MDVVFIPYYSSKWYRSKKAFLRLSISLPTSSHDKVLVFVSSNLTHSSLDF